MKVTPVHHSALRQYIYHRYQLALPFLILFLAILLWEGSLIVGRAVHEMAAPLHLAFFRWLLASVIITLVAFPRISRQWPLMIKNWKRLFCLGLTGMAAYSFLVFKALNDTTAINSAILVTMIPVVILLLSWLFYGEKIKLGQLSGILLSFFGAVVVITEGHLYGLAGFQLHPGDFWMLAALPVWAIYTILLQKMPEGLDAVSTLAGSAYVGVLILLPFQLYQDFGGHMMLFSLDNILALLYMGGVASVGAFFLWGKGVALVGANRAGVFLYLTPVLAAVLSVLLLGEDFHVFQAMGMILVLAGVVLTNRYSPKNK
ncbi:MAG: DMT family transporter [Bacteroidetes bacterium]|nr:MAG: DMT family transporter [Bacteroidota bacterium]